MGGERVGGRSVGGLGGWGHDYVDVVWRRERVGWGGGEPYTNQYPTLPLRFYHLHPLSLANILPRFHHFIPYLGKYTPQTLP